MSRSDSMFFAYIDQYESTIRKSREDLQEVNSVLSQEYYDTHAIYYPLVEKGYDINYLLDLPVAEFTLLQLRIIEVEEERAEEMRKSMQNRG